MNSLIETLKENGQDFEFYPTTKEMVGCIARSIISAGEHHSSILDIGAGNGNFFDLLEGFNGIDENGYKRINITKYAIEKSSILIQSMAEDIFIIGTDFHHQTLIDKKVDIIFCNPPYKEYVMWAEKIIREANSKYIYLIIPERWKESEKILNVIEKRTEKKDNNYKIISSFDFEYSEFRVSRAKVDIIKIDLTGGQYSRNELRVDPFSLWFEDNFKIDADKGKSYDYEDKKKQAEDLKNLIKGQNLIERLEELYVKALEELLNTYKIIETLNPSLLKELDINIDGVKAGLKLKIEGLKNIYWHELFDNMKSLTDKLTSKSRKDMLGKLTGNTNIDFTADNAYAVVIWAIKNANKYIDKQLCEVYMEMTEPKNVKNYKSNKKMIDDMWRYSRHDAKGKHTHYTLDYRIVCERMYCFNSDTFGAYDYPNGLAKSAHDFLNDICVVARNLGFDVFDSSFRYQWTPGKSKDFCMNLNDKVETFMEVRPYKKGTIHLKINQEFMKAFNIEASRLNGWVKSAQEIVEETEIDLGSAVLHFGKNTQIKASNVKLLMSR